MQFRGGPICWVALFLTVPGIQAVDDHGAATSNITEQRASTNNPETKVAVWSNWQNTITCHPRKVSQPTTIHEVQALVQNNTRVRPAGFGHSFNRAVCADGGLMLDMSSMNDVLELNTHESYVRTEPGVSTRQLLNWLREKGWTLPTYPYFIDQTIAGAVATATHGSSTKIGSLSSLLLALKIVTADGRVVQFTPEDGEDWEAARVSVGLLGVIVELKLRVVRDRRVWRVCELVSGQQIQTAVDLFAKTPEAVDGLHYFYSPLYNTAISIVPKEKLGSDDKWAPVELGPITVEGGNVLLSQALPTQTQELTALLANTLGSYDQYEFFTAQDLASGCLTAFLEFFRQNPLLSAGVIIPMAFRFVKEESAHISASNGGARLCINVDDYDSYMFNKPLGLTTPAAKGAQSATFNQIKELMRSPKCQARIHFGKASVYSAVSGDWTRKDLDYVRNVWGSLGGKMGANNTGDEYARFRQVAMSWDPEGKFRDGEGFLE